MTGGKGDGKPDTAFDRKSLSKGIASELEHTSNPAVAKEIAKDHLSEDRSAYEKEGKFSFPYKIRPSSVSGQECLDEIEERFMNSVAKRNSGSTLQAPMTLGGVQKESQWQTYDQVRSAPETKARGPIADALFGVRAIPGKPGLPGRVSVPENLRRMLSRNNIGSAANSLGQGINWWATEGTHHVGPDGQNLTPIGKLMAVPYIAAPSLLLPEPRRHSNYELAPNQQGRFVPDPKPSDGQSSINWRNGALLGAGALAGAGGLYAWYRHKKKKQEELERQRLAAQSKSASAPDLGTSAGAMVESKPGIGWGTGAMLGAGALGTGAMLGAGALAGAGGLYAAHRYLNRKKKPDEEVDKAAEIKYADVTPFAAGFFISCRTKGYSLPQVREFTKIACETDAKIAEQLSCLDNNFWLFMTTSKQAGIGNSIGNMFDSGTQWLSQTAPVQYVANKLRDNVVTPAKTYVEGQLQQGAANEVSRRMDALGFNPEGGIGKFFVDYNKEGLMPAITNAWGGMTPAQKMSLLAMIGGPLIGAGTAMAGHPGLGAMIGLGGLAAGGAGMYFGGNNAPKLTPTPANPQDLKKVPQPIPTQQQPIQAQPMAQPTAQPAAAPDETAALNKGFQDMRSTTTVVRPSAVLLDKGFQDMRTPYVYNPRSTTTTLTNPGGPALPKPPTSDGITS
jgi:hypothetical protein